MPTTHLRQQKPLLPQRRLDLRPHLRDELTHGREAFLRGGVVAPRRPPRRRRAGGAACSRLLGLLAARQTPEQILAAYPYLEAADIDEALHYAASLAEDETVELAG